MCGQLCSPRNVLLSSLGEAAGAAPVRGWLAPPRAPASPAERYSLDCCVGFFSVLSTLDLTSKSVTESVTVTALFTLFDGNSTQHGTIA